MISIIICGRDNCIPPNLSLNISQTIGCSFEIIYIPSPHKGICHVYSQAIKQARGEILCFQHDDLFHLTNNWGELISNLFRGHPDIGLVGVNGAHYLPASPFYWTESPFQSGFHFDTDQGVRNMCDEWHGGGGITDVAAIDGQIMLAPRKLFSSIQFDEKTFPLYHGYDMDISMQVLKLGYRVVVSRTFLSEHHWQESKWDDPHLQSALRTAMHDFSKKWKSDLPIIRGINLSKAEISRLEVLFHKAHDASLARNSTAYKLGKILLSPIRLIKRILS